jgi:hypothetical protein
MRRVPRVASGTRHDGRRKPFGQRADSASIGFYQHCVQFTGTFIGIAKVNIRNNLLSI